MDAIMTNYSKHLQYGIALVVDCCVLSTEQCSRMVE